MIRDPSDGTVKPAADERAAGIKPPIDVGTSGLAKLKADEIERLKQSREWLAQYRKAVDDVNRMNDKGEIPPPEQGEG